jgi:hypothetical protein
MAGTVHVECDRCGTQMDTEHRWGQNPVGAAEELGWQMGARVRHNHHIKKGEDLCPSCVAKGSRPLNDLETEMLQTLEGVDAFFTALGKYTKDYPGGVHTHEFVREMVRKAKTVQ